MSLTTLVVHQWECNGCRSTRTKKMLVDRGGVLPAPEWRVEGWLHISNIGLDYCPECRGKIVWPGSCER